MALIMPKTSTFGIEVNYWKITQYSFINSPQNISLSQPAGVGVCSIEICGWTDKAARDSLYAPLISMSVIADQDYATKEDMYNFIKTLPDFALAIDDV